VSRRAAFSLRFWALFFGFLRRLSSFCVVVVLLFFCFGRFVLLFFCFGCFVRAFCVSGCFARFEKKKKKKEKKEKEKSGTGTPHFS
jgi:hypothetical protein